MKIYNFATSKNENPITNVINTNSVTLNNNEDLEEKNDNLTNTEEREKKYEELKQLLNLTIVETNTGALYAEKDEEKIDINDESFIKAIKTYTDQMFEEEKEKLARFVERKDYKIPTDPVEIFDFKWEDQDKEVVTVERTYKNKIDKGNFELSKTDVSTGEIIPGAGIRVYDDTTKNVVCEGTTNKDGKLNCSELPVGTYYFQEYDAPEGYIIDESLFKFEIKSDGETVKAKMTNKKEEIEVPKTSRDKSYKIYLISAFMLLIGSLISISYIKRNELRMLFNKLKNNFKK